MNSNWSYSPETSNLGQNQRFFSRVTLKFDRWPWKTIGHLSLATSSFFIISSSYVNSNWSYSPETAKLGYDLCDLDLWPWPFAWTSLLSLVITPENFVMIQWQEDSEKVWQTDRRTDGRTERGVLRAAWSQLKKILKKKHKKVRAPIKLTYHWSWQLYISVQFLKCLTISLTEIEPHTGITNQPEESKEKR